MKRIPESDLMDSIEQARAYAETDFSEPHDAFVELFRRHFPGFEQGKVLDLGCGAADVIIRFARALPGTHITGIDGSEAMLAIGLQDVNKHKLIHQIELKKRYLPDPGLSNTMFDAVISNSLLHHLDDPMVLWETIYNCTREDAPVFVMDLIRQDSAEEAQKIVELYAADASPVLKTDFYNSLLAAYNIEEVRAQLADSNLDGLNTEVVSDRHFIAWGTK
jgi:ubiquinone/menaquinone biosynthesis C-methylase UbiE